MASRMDVPTLLKQKGYEELDRIGEGAFGRAILVQSQDGAKMVCKLVDVSRASSKELRDAVKEGTCLAMLKHPYIVRYRDSFTEAGWFALLMDFCEGGDLTKRIDQARRRRQPIAEDQVLKWFTQATLALKYIHERHILHRDLKPGNFFLTKNGVLKMGDFGISKELSSTLACARTQIGTPYYLSPEVCEEQPYAWPSDIWALGCILYELCALKVPFEGKNIHHLVQRIITGQVPLVPGGYSECVRLLCEEMLDRNPGRRPSAEDILKRPEIQIIVQQLLDEAKAAEGPPPPKAPTFKKGDYVEYHSATHSDWLPAKVIKEEPGGKVVIDLKPNTWMSQEEQLQKLRHRKEPPKLIDRSSAYPRCGSTPAIAGPSRADGAGALNGALPSVPRRSGSARSLEQMPNPSGMQRSPSAPAVAQGPGPIPRSRSRSVNSRHSGPGSRSSSRAPSPAGIQGSRGTPKSSSRRFSAGGLLG